MMRLRVSQHGFTLVEMMVYLAIFMVVSTGAVTLLLSLDEFIAQYQVDAALYRSGTGVMEQVVTELRRADQFDSTNSVLETTATGALALFAGASSTQFVKVGDDIVLQKDGVEWGALNTDAVSVTGFTVYRYITAAGTLVRVHLELSASVADTTKTVDFYGGAIIRGAL